MSINVLAAALMAVAVDSGAPAPERPRATVDTALPRLAGRTIEVPAGGNLQTALERARPGDAIELAPGAVYRGPFTLPAKHGDGWIVITTAGAGETLPPSGTRVTPADAQAMGVLETEHGSVVSAAPGAGRYRFIGVLMRPAAGKFLHNLVSLGTDAKTYDELPHHIVFDRCILLGDPEAGTRRGIALNSRDTAVIDSHLAQFKEAGADSQAIAGWNGPGPFRIVNNYLEGAGENVMFGGALAHIPGLVPADIEIRGNRFAKPLRWMVGHPEYAGTPWTVKNLFELKNARRVLIDGNLFEYSWHHAQTGFAILFTVRTEDGKMPWAVVEDVNFTNNIVRHAGSGISFLGRDVHGESVGLTRRILVANNLFDDIGGDWGDGRLFQLIDGTSDIAIRNNAARRHTGSIIVADGRPHERFVFMENSAQHNEYGIHGSGTASGTATLERYFPGAIVRDNVIVGGSAAAYPRGNRFGRLPDLARLCVAMRESQSPLVAQAVCE